MRGFNFPLRYIKGEKGTLLLETSMSNEDLPSGTGGRIALLLSTLIGTRAFRYSYGIGIAAVFKLYSGMESNFKKEIVESINHYIKGVEINESDIDFVEDSGSLSVNIPYSERDIQQVTTVRII